jgi:hypothetical protein
MVQNRLALLGKQSVSVVTGGSALPGQLGEPTDAYLYHWQ